MLTVTYFLFGVFFIILHLSSICILHFLKLYHCWTISFLYFWDIFLVLKLHLFSNMWTTDVYYLQFWISYLILYWFGGLNENVAAMYGKLWSLLSLKKRVINKFKRWPNTWFLKIMKVPLYFDILLRLKWKLYLFDVMLILYYCFF